DLEVVEPFEVRGGHEHLSAHLDQRGVAAAAEALRDAVDLQRVYGDVLAGAAFAAGGRGDQLAVLVAEVDRQAFDLQLGEAAHRVAALRRGVGASFAQLLEGEDVVQALHPLGVVDRGQACGGRAAHGAGGRVLGGRLRVRL